MKLTKLLKDKVRNEMSKATEEANKKARADYDNRREKAKEELAELIKRITPEAVAILEKYGMDSEGATAFASEKYYNQIIRCDNYYVENKEEAKRLREEENARYKREGELITDFFIECELGVEKTDFLDALANLCKKITE